MRAGVLFRTGSPLTSGIRYPRLEVPIMPRVRFLTVASPAPFRHGAAHSMWAVEQRLASAERELRIQFTRIAQLQAELDLLMAALRHSGDAAHAR